MFNPDFYPTPIEVIALMLDGVPINDKIFLEPSGGSGNIVDYLLSHGALDVVSCESDDKLVKILQSKCKVIERDFLKLTSDKISHIDYIIMNPPFSRGADHILHAWNIAPSGCKIVALCNSETLKNTYSSSRQELHSAVKNYGGISELGDCFATAERKTGVKVSMVTLTKPAGDYETEFDGFFMEDDEEELQQNGLMQYNAVRDLVNRYVAAVKIFDKQLEFGVQMNNLTTGFFTTKLAFEVTKDGAPHTRNNFKKEMQKSGWEFIFKKLNMQKYATQGLKEDINKFIEQKTNIPFTMRNIYVMLQTIIDTQEQQMDKAIVQVFDKLTQHYHDNRYSVEGWKTNSHYLMGEKFILPYLCETDKWHTGNKVKCGYGGNFELIEDMLKAICYITGEKYDDFLSLKNFLESRWRVSSFGKYNGYHSVFRYHDVNGMENYRKKLYEEGKNPKVEDFECEYGQLYDWGFFQIRCFKKGTIHFTFKDKEVWARFNQRVAKIKGYPLFEGVKKTPKKEPVKNTSSTFKPTVLATFTV